MCDSKLVEKLNQIRHKLEKHSKVKDVLKIKTYLNELNNIEDVNLEVLKESQIVECLKALKKKEDPDYSPKADVLIKKWKNIIMKLADRGEQETKNVPKLEKIERKDLPSIQTKRPLSETNDFSSKKPKPNEPNSNPFETLSVKSEPKSHESESLKIPIVPMPTTRLEDILSVESLPSTKNSSSSKNYSLMTQNLESSKQSMPLSSLDEDEVLRKILMNKQSKRLLYTGRKTNANGAPMQVPKLFEIATRNLVENLDDLPLRISSYNSRNQFPVAYDLIVKVLERANSRQLQNIEYYSPNLLEDTDELWKKLCEQEFKMTCTLEEDETWRELYFRKFDEREEKFRRARDLISRKQAEKPKERQTQVATVKFVSSTSKSSSSVLSSSSAASKLKVLNSSSGPVRQIVHDSSGRKGGSASLGPKRPVIPTGPAMSQGMKATMKLIKKTTSRR